MAKPLPSPTLDLRFKQLLVSTQRGEKRWQEISLRYSVMSRLPQQPALN